MPGRKRSVDLSVEARRDLREILLFTRTTWGKAQSDRYADHFRRTFDRLASYPELGVPREEIFAGCRSRVVQNHVIYYRLLDQNVWIIRILHSSQEAFELLGVLSP